MRSIRRPPKGMVLLGLLSALGGCSSDTAGPTRPSPSGAPQSALTSPGVGETSALEAAQQARRAAKMPTAPAARNYLEMSEMGAIAAGLIPRPDRIPVNTGRPSGPLTEAIGSPDTVVHSLTAIAGQAETAIASNSDASVLIAGYTDARGFSTTPSSLSGVARSIDGGRTWAEVPVGPGGAGTLPSVAGGHVGGHPDVKYDPTRSRFIYSSIFVRPSDNIQGLAIHYSNTDGSSWTGPVQVSPSFIVGDANMADHEFIDINPVTGRLYITWTQFSTFPARILVSYTDDLGATWSPAATVMEAPTGGGVQASMPRVLPGTNNGNSTLYVVWSTSTPTTDGRNIGCSRSTDGGATFDTPVFLDTDYAREDQILGVDRTNNSPALAIDYTSGRVYVVYQRNDAFGTGDVALRTFVGACQTGAPLLLSSNPGNDRAQFYPFVAVDQTTRRAHVAFYDQDAPPTGDLTETMHTYSDDQGLTWSPPTPLTDRPFHAGYGNDTSQPNLGDYNGGVALNGRFYSVWTGTSVAPRYDDGQPTSASFITPDTYFDITDNTQVVAPLRLAGTTTSDANFCTAGGNNASDPGETLDLTVALENYVGNPSTGATTVRNIRAALSTSTPGVVINRASANYSDLAPLTTENGQSAFSFTLSAGFVPGTFIDFRLDVTSDQGAVQLPFRVATGQGGTPTVVLNEDFTTTTITVSQTPPSTVWASVRGGGPTSVSPWAISQALTPGNNAAFHDEANTTSFIRLFSPAVALPNPAGPSYVTLDFDLVYDLEEDPTQLITAYDGMTLRIFDNTAGALARSILAEAFAEQILTGNTLHFPRHLPRSNTTAYFQDQSSWSGRSGGPVHVSMRFPGAGLVGRSVQLRFEYTQDGSGLCSDLGANRGPCGVAIDNVRMAVVPVVSGACTPVVAVCGDGRLQMGEQCDDGNTSDGDCCSSNCQYESTATVCRSAADPCDVAETCNGAGACAPDVRAANGAACDDGNACTLTDTCQADVCVGANPVICAPLDPCHGAGTCDPRSGACSNPNAPDGTSCNDNTVCNGAETCQAGTCTAGTPPNCDDRDACTADSCDPTGGCQYTSSCDGGTGSNDGSTGNNDGSTGGDGGSTGGDGGSTGNNDGSTGGDGGGGGGQGCSCEIGGRTVDNERPMMFALTLLLGLFSLRRYQHAHRRVAARTSRT